MVVLALTRHPGDAPQRTSPRARKSRRQSSTRPHEALSKERTVVHDDPSSSRKVRRALKMHLHLGAVRDVRWVAAHFGHR